MKLKLTFIIIFVISVILFSITKIMIEKTEEFSGVELNLTYQELEKEEFYILLTETFATEKIIFIITNDKNYYYIKYYSVPFHFIPIAKYKMQKKYLKIINYKEGSENYFSYNCIGNFKIQEQDELGYYNDDIKKDCLK